MSVINVNHVTFYYDGSYETIFEDVSFSAEKEGAAGEKSLRAGAYLYLG